MEFDTKEKQLKTKLIGVRLYKDEYDLISDIASSRYPINWKKGRNSVR